MIVELRIENVKRIQAATLRPPSGVVSVGGRNAQGKSSVLDAIAMALGGAKQIPTRPIREGADRAEVEVRLDNGMTIRRTMTASGERLTVESDGKRYASPQAMLDELFGAVCLDPVRFARASKRDQSEQLRAAAGLNLDEIDKQISEAEQNRLSAGRAAKAATAIAEAHPLPASVPRAIDVSAAVRELAEARSSLEARNQAIAYRDMMSERKRRAVEQMAALKEELADLDCKIAESIASSSDVTSIQEDIARLEALITSSKQVDRERASAAEAIRASTDRDNKLAAHKLAEEHLEVLRADRARMISGASWPVDGLSIDDSGEISLHGLPLDQASSAELVCLSCELALAGGGAGKVLLVREGSLLDGDSMQAMLRTAEQHEAQIWIERVGSDQACSVIIEDGCVSSQ